MTLRKGLISNVEKAFAILSEGFSYRRAMLFKILGDLWNAFSYTGNSFLWKIVVLQPA